MNRRLLASASFVLLSASATIAQAAVTGTYDLNETFSYPASAVGSFFYDSSNNQVSDVNITISDANGPSVLNTNWNSVNGTGTFLTGNSSVETLFVDAGNQSNNYNDGMYLSFDISGSTLTLVDAGSNFGSNSLYDWRNYNLYNSSELSADNYRTQTLGLSVTAAVPEPATVTLMGLALAGFVVVRKKRSH